MKVTRRFHSVYTANEVPIPQLPLKEESIIRVVL